jgi:hypothetical protein
VTATLPHQSSISSNNSYFGRGMRDFYCAFYPPGRSDRCRVFSVCFVDSYITVALMTQPWQNVSIVASLSARNMSGSLPHQGGRRYGPVRSVRNSGVNTGQSVRRPLISIKPGYEWCPLVAIRIFHGMSLILGEALSQVTARSRPLAILYTWEYEEIVICPGWAPNPRSPHDPGTRHRHGLRDAVVYPHGRVTL